MSAENTETVEVPPGDETGIYYITMCNLPFGVGWPETKAWVREKSGVKVYAEIFSSSTSGWVRVKGKEDFEKAWKLLNGGTFNDRSIIADDKNRTQTIRIKKKLVPSQQEQLPPPPGVSSQMTASRPAAQRQQVAVAPPATSPEYSSTPGQYYPTGYNQAGGLSYSGQPMPTQGYALQPSAMVGSQGFFDYSGANAGPSSGVAYSPNYQYDGTQFALPYRGPQETPAYYAGAGAGSGAPPPGQEPAYQTGYVETEARKLHVSSFPQDTSPEEVIKWIRHKIYEKQTILNIEIPKSGNKKYIRGHVFVTFDSTPAATTAMEQLNKAKFKGRKVIARPTAEGVAMSEPTASSAAARASEANLGPARIPTGPRDDRSRGDKPQRPRHRESNKRGDADRKRSSDKKSSSAAKKSSKTSSKKTLPLPDKDKDKKGSSSTKDVGPPVIVNGSSRRHDKR